MDINFDIAGAKKAGATDSDLSNYFKTNYNIAKQYETLGSRNEYNFALTSLKKDYHNHHFMSINTPGCHFYSRN